VVTRMAATAPLRPRSTPPPPRSGRDEWATSPRQHNRQRGHRQPPGKLIRPNGQDTLAVVPVGPDRAQRTRTRRPVGAPTQLANAPGQTREARGLGKPSSEPRRCSIRAQRSHAVHKIDVARSGALGQPPVARFSRCVPVLRSKQDSRSRPTAVPLIASARLRSAAGPRRSWQQSTARLGRSSYRRSVLPERQPQLSEPCAQLIAEPLVASRQLQITRDFA
jgi:hypothetical protein